MKPISRRNFIKGSLAAGAAITIPYRVFSQVRGAHDDIRVAVAGLNGKGAQHVEIFRNLPGVRVVALCDPDYDVLDREVSKFKDRKEDVDAYIDVRHLLEDQSIDALVIATPNHWHSLMGIWACQAGKDVYVEKPVSHTIWEGQQLVQAARQFNRIVQAGTQNRSDVGLIEAVKYIQEEMLGKINIVRGFCYKYRTGIGKVDGPQPIPTNVDYDLWCGPATKGPLTRKNLHYDWHWQWEFGNGDIGNQGVHEMDVCRWILQKEELPFDVVSLGGRFAFNDDGETANTQVAMFTWDNKTPPVVFEVRNLPRKKDDTITDNYKGARTDVVVECEHGYFVGGCGGGWVYDNDGNKVKQFQGDGGSGHQENFIQAVRSRKAKDLNADINQGHLSSAMCHIANISLRMGDAVLPERVKLELTNIWKKELAFEAYERMLEHLKANEIELKLNYPILGRLLMMNSRLETFTGLRATEANTYLKRNYREPYVVPYLGDPDPNIPKTSSNS